MFSLSQAHISKTCTRWLSTQGPLTCLQEEFSGEGSRELLHGLISYSLNTSIFGKTLPGVKACAEHSASVCRAYRTLLTM